MIKISIIVPCFDIKKTIDSCLNSINKQHFSYLRTKLEVICIVDGNYEDFICIKLWRKRNLHNLNFELKIIILKENQGPGFARYTGFKASSGEFIAFLDDDDVWNDSKLEVQLDWHLKNPDKIMSGHLYSNGIDYMNTRTKKLKEISLTHLLIGGVRIATPSIMIRKAIWPYQPEKQRFCEDWLMISMIASIQNIYIIPKILAFRSDKALPIDKDKSSLSNKKLRIRLGKIMGLIILFKRNIINFYSLILLIIFQVILLLKNIYTLIIKKIRI